MAGIMLKLVSVRAHFPLSAEFKPCPTQPFMTPSKQQGFFATDLYTGIFTPLVTHGNHKLEAHGYSPQHNRIVGSNTTGEYGLFFAGPSRTHPSTIAIDVKSVGYDIASYAGDVISDNNPGTPDIWYGMVNGQWDMMVPLMDPDNLSLIQVAKYGYPTDAVTDIAFVDSGPYGITKKVWFSVTTNQENKLILLRGIVDMGGTDIKTDVQNMGVLVSTAWDSTNIYDGGEIGAVYADASNYIYAGVNETGVIYRVDVSDPVYPDMVVSMTYSSPIPKTNDASRCRFAGAPKTKTEAIVAIGSDLKSEFDEFIKYKLSLLSKFMPAQRPYIPTISTTPFMAPIPTNRPTHAPVTTTEPTTESTTTTTESTTTTTESTTTAPTTTSKNTTTTPCDTTVNTTKTTTTTPCLTTKTATTTPYHTKTTINTTSTTPSFKELIYSGVNSDIQNILAEKLKVVDFLGGSTANGIELINDILEVAKGDLFNRDGLVMGVADKISNDIVSVLDHTYEGIMAEARNKLYTFVHGSKNLFGKFMEDTIIDDILSNSVATKALIDARLIDLTVGAKDAIDGAIKEKMKSGSYLSKGGHLRVNGGLFKYLN